MKTSKIILILLCVLAFANGGYLALEFEFLAGAIGAILIYIMSVLLAMSYVEYKHKEGDLK